MLLLHFRQREQLSEKPCKPWKSQGNNSVVSETLEK